MNWKKHLTLYSCFKKALAFMILFTVTGMVLVGFDAPKYWLIIPISFLCVACFFGIIAAFLGVKNLLREE